MKIFFSHYKILILALLTACSQSSDAFLQKGKELMREGKTAEAIEYLNKSIDKNLKNAEAFNTRGVAHFELKSYENAMLDYGQAIQIEPSLYKPYFNRALLFTAQNRLSDALADYNKAVEAAPDTADVYLNRGQVLALLDSIPAATSDFEKAVSLNGKNVQAWYNLGNTYYRLKDYPRAIANFRKATLIDPKFGKAFYGLGLAQHDNGDKEIGCNSLKQALNTGYSEAATAIEKYCKSVEN